MRKIRPFLIIAFIITATLVFAAGFECPSCGSSMIWTGKIKTEWGQLFYLHRCPAGHEYWFKSTSDYSSRETQRESLSSSYSLKCPVCGAGVIWTGKTFIEWGKLLKIYRCPAGHESVGE